jgi:hypothetical protein
MTRCAINDDFSLSSNYKFVASAAYFESMDCIEYVKCDAVLVSDRIDEFLTVIRNEDGIMVGFKVKGIKNYFLQNLQPALSLSDDDFVYVKDIFVALTTKLGDDLFADNDEKRTAYRDATRIASNDNVRLAMPHSIAA